MKRRKVTFDWTTTKETLKQEVKDELAADVGGFQPKLSAIEAFSGNFGPIVDSSSRSGPGFGLRPSSHANANRTLESPTVSRNCLV